MDQKARTQLHRKFINHKIFIFIKFTFLFLQSLNNNVFLKQIAKLKHYTGSTKTINSLTSSTDSSSTQNLNQFHHTSSINGSTTNTNSGDLGVPKSLFNIFKTKSNSSLSEIGVMNKSSNFLSKLTSSSGSSTNKLNTMNFFNRLSSQIKSNDFDDDENEKNTSITVNNLNQTDLVFDELSGILNKSTGRKVILDEDFKEKMKLIVQQTELTKKHEIDKVRWMCRIMTLVFFLFMFIFFIVFVVELHSIGNKLLNQLNNLSNSSHSL